MGYWLMKSEPDVYSIDDLRNAGGPAMWEGCRNYVVRNYFRDSMKIGDMAFFHNSNSNPNGIIGTMEIVSEPYPDPTQFDPTSNYYDPKSPKEAPRWILRDVLFKEKFKAVISMDDMRAVPGLADSQVLRKGQRLSVMPVTDDEWKIIMSMAQR